MTYQAPSPPVRALARRQGGATNKPIDRIVIHCTVSTCCTSAAQIADYFAETSRAASAHYIVDATEIYQSVFDSRVAYHAPPNEHSLGIELCCTLTNAGKGHWRKADHKQMLAKAARLVAELCLAYDIPPYRVVGKGLKAGKRGVTGHADVRDAWGQTTHWDPGPHFPWRRFMAQVREEIKAIEAAAAGKPVKAKNTRVRKARMAIAVALDSLAQVPASRKRVHKVAAEIADDLHKLPEQ